MLKDPYLRRRVATQEKCFSIIPYIFSSLREEGFINENDGLKATAMNLPCLTARDFRRC